MRAIARNIGFLIDVVDEFFLFLDNPDDDVSLPPLDISGLMYNVLASASGSAFVGHIKASLNDNLGVPSSLLQLAVNLHHESFPVRSKLIHAHIEVPVSAFFTTTRALTGKFGFVRQPEI